MMIAANGSGTREHRTTSASPSILDVSDLRVYYGTNRGNVRAVDGVNFNVRKRERFGLVGESGCGKSTTAMAILRLIKPPAFIQSGKILLDGIDMTTLDSRALKQTRWRKLAVILQGAMNSLNPVMRVREQIADVIQAHEQAPSGKQLEERIDQLLNRVELPSRVATMYPHELSGGMKQRVCIAMATALDPPLIVADEPTSALDVVVQRAVMETLIEVQDRIGSSLILIGHDMGLQAQVADRLAVMYAGKIVELGSGPQLFKQSLHPYTRLLISSLPSLARKTGGGERITGLPPSLLNPPRGCRFHPRCSLAKEVCRQTEPELQEITPGHFAACHLLNDR